MDATMKTGFFLKNIEKILRLTQCNLLLIHINKPDLITHLQLKFFYADTN